MQAFYKKKPVYYFFLSLDIKQVSEGGGFVNFQNNKHPYTESFSLGQCRNIYDLQWHLNGSGAPAYRQTPFEHYVADFYADWVPRSLLWLEFRGDQSVDFVGWKVTNFRNVHQLVVTYHWLTLAIAPKCRGAGLCRFWCSKKSKRRRPHRYSLINDPAVMRMSTKSWFPLYFSLKFILI